MLLDAIGADRTRAESSSKRMTGNDSRECRDGKRRVMYVDVRRVPSLCCSGWCESSESKRWDEKERGRRGGEVVWVGG